MDNNYKTLKAALMVARDRLDAGQMVNDNADDWDIDNLIDSIDTDEDTERGGYYCVGYDGSVGYTEDDGYNINWLYKPC